MKYYISKPISHELDRVLVIGIKKIDTEAVFVANLCDADICVFQRGWTKSKKCVSDYHLARDKKIKREEGYLYTDKYIAKTNKSTK